MKTNDNCCPPAEALDALQRLAPDAPLLALGQTIFWDEPMKLALLRHLAAHAPTRSILFGVHDTDYFARLHTRQLPRGAQVIDGFALLPHNDGSTRALWSAAGEIAQLFGSETVPTLQMFAHNGGHVARVAESCSEGRSAFIDALTEAWGWRGLVARDPAPRPVCEIPLHAVAPALDALLEFGLDGSCQMLEDADARARACAWASALRARVRQYADAHPNGSLADLFVALYPELLESLHGGALPDAVGFTRTTELLRFNTRTAGLPRFALVDAFVNPATRRACEDAYNAAVADSPIYTLDEFGEGALPFDLLIPQVGRGTLLLTERYLVVLTPEPQIVRLPAPIADVHGLAQVIEAQWGDACTLVGKAITLVPMLAREFVFVFNERGSPYLTRTARFLQGLQAGGVEARVHPLLRLRYPTWDTLSAARCVNLRLPEHLARAFGEPTLCSDVLALRWRAVIAEQRQQMEQLAQARRPRALMALLTERAGERWREARATYDASLHALAETIGRHADTLRQHAHALHAERRALIAEIQRNPKQFAALAPRLHALKTQIRRLNAERLQVGHTPEAEALRARVRQLECAAERARLEQIRDAYLTVEGLLQTHARPAAWWFLLLGRAWFEACAEGLQARLEPLA
ncbi:MAG: hypothetical protein WHS44_03535 [Fimbriimonadales bacterium]|nr:MAG: hypothetical protein KatS3mg018_1832 [Fimbriimonadales bacterium]